jgi:molybdopterin/thiamine biosynthesis adenylyltransferase
VASTRPSTARAGAGRGATVVVVGLGNIGSHLVPHLARSGAVARVVLIDKDRYEEKNVRAQAIASDAIGMSKAQAQGHRLQRINAALGVVFVESPVQRLPLGLLRGDAILACVDSRAARQYLSQAARHLGVPLVDAGVRADGRLARVSVFRPEPSAACLECSWDQADYDAIEQTHPCSADDPESPATNAPAWLGALAAALQAAECDRILEGAPAPAGGSFETVLEAVRLRQQTTSFRRNARCRLDDHEPWVVETLECKPSSLTVNELLRVGPWNSDRERGARVSVPGAAFVTRLTCLECGETRDVLRLRRAARLGDAPCSRCGGRLDAAGPDLIDALSPRSVPPALLEQPASTLGMLPGDIVAVARCGRTYHLQLGEAAV